MDILNKNILITGGLGAIGSSIANYLQELGANIIVFDNQPSQEKNIFAVDVTNFDEVQQVINTIDKIDVLINCAGEIYSEPIINVLEKKVHSIASWERIINKNLTSTFIMGTCVAQKMISTRTKGVIINFSSVSAKGNMGQIAYSSAKAGVEALTKVQAKELGLFQIRSCAIAPGFIETKSTQKALSSAIIDYYKKQTPLKKLGTVKDIISTVQFIIENDFINGTIISVDGCVTI